MSRYCQAIAIVEGTTEQKFVEQVLGPYLAQKGVYISATQVSKKGQKGGDVKFDRVKQDIVNHLKARCDSIVTMMLDYYGIVAWPGLDCIKPNFTPSQIENVLVRATIEEIKKLVPKINVEKRFYPFFMVHEFETLLFSDVAILSKRLGVDKMKIDATLKQFRGEIEQINNSRATAPSKRIEERMPSFKKTVNGIVIAEEIGIESMRVASPLFNDWVTQFEALVN